ncbi:hypothetical protein E3U55_07670 [Filobacillus milosensis]|uniref:Uncharacterized protein n=1 Tax=Filobacillus milosensis TaxID=94137 RepID=A0A4Y8IKP2_9BACI|nr:hypothetical protein [Filobacillus milosensis]TFB21706.1 hypothetical protein E3U55_07670 [Filobacillus milosensis]
MDKKDERDQADINVKLGGMAVYGTTSNKAIGGYKASGDIEKAGKLDEFEKPEEADRQSDASIKAGEKEQY